MAKATYKVIRLCTLP